MSKEIVRLPVVNRSHISYSEYQLFLNCNWRWVLDYVQERRSKVQGIELSFGTAIHSTLELLKSAKKSERPSIEKAQSFFVRKLVKEHMVLKKIPNKKEYKLRDYITAGKNILARIDQCEQIKEGVVLWNEHELLEDIERTDDIKVKFKGYIDIAIKVTPSRGKPLLFICDFKTCSWGWTFDKKNDPQVQAQLVLYKHFVCKKFNLDPKNVRTAFILLKKKPKTPEDTVEFFSFSTGPKTMEKIMNTFQSDITRMFSGVYEKNRKFCKSKYGDVCPYYNTELCSGPVNSEPVINVAKGSTNNAET